MSRERTNVIGIVALTMCVTAAALVGGWLAASRYLGLGQQTVTAAPEAMWSLTICFGSIR